jgi:hypothetical protein
MEEYASLVKFEIFGCTQSNLYLRTTGLESITSKSIRTPKQYILPKATFSSQLAFSSVPGVKVSFT